jgi:predicted aspartyl protease
MGHKEIEVEIKGEKGSKIMKLLVDTGSTYTWIDKKVAEEIGIKKLGTHKFKTIEGKIIKREVGEDRIRNLCSCRKERFKSSWSLRLRGVKARI